MRQGKKRERACGRGRGNVHEHARSERPPWGEAFPGDGNSPAGGKRADELTCATIVNWLRRTSCFWGEWDGKDRTTTWHPSVPAATVARATAGGRVGPPRVEPRHTRYGSRKRRVHGGNPGGGLGGPKAVCPSARWSSCGRHDRAARSTAGSSRHLYCTRVVASKPAFLRGFPSGSSAGGFKKCERPARGPGESLPAAWSAPRKATRLPHGTSHARRYVGSVVRRSGRIDTLLRQRVRLRQARLRGKDHVDQRAPRG